MSDEFQEFKLPGGETIRGKELDFEIVKETWSEYALSDGNILRVKTNLLRAVQVFDKDGKPEVNETGDPVIVANTSVIVFLRAKA